MRFTQFLLAGLSTLALAACSSIDDNSTWDGQNPGDVKFSSYIEGQKESRVTGAQWAAGDAVGIYMKTTGTELSAATVANRKYTSDALGNLTAASTDQAIAYPESGNVDFVAYYPYTAGVSGTNVPVNVATQTSQAAIDLIYSDNATNKQSSSDAVALGFTHQLTNVKLTITAASGIGSTAGLKVSVTGVPTATTFDLATGKLADATTTGDVAFNVAADGTAAEAILIPQASTSAAKMKFTLGDKTVETAVSVPAFAAGTLYTIPVKLTVSGSQIFVSFGQATITDWTTVPGGDLTVDFNDGTTTDPGQTEGDGSKAKPFSIAQAIAKQDNSYAWVTGYIVGYVNGASIKDGAKFDLSDAANVSQTNILIAATPDEKDYSKCIPVQLPAGSDVRTKVNLKDNAANLGKAITLYGQLTKYFSVSGIKSASAAIIAGGSLIGTDPDKGGTTEPDQPATDAPGVLTKAADIVDGGIYAFGYSADGKTFNLMENKVKGTYYVSMATWTKGQSVPADCQFTLKKSGNGWQIVGADGKFVYGQVNGTHYNLKVGGTSAETWTATDEGTAIKFAYPGIDKKWICYTTYNNYNEYSFGYAGTSNFYPSLYRIK